MNIYAAIEDAMGSIEEEVTRSLAAEGLPPLMFTGRIELDHSTRRCWFELLDPAPAITSWVTADAPELAAFGETLCTAASLEEAFMLGQD